MEDYRLCPATTEHYIRLFLQLFDVAMTILPSKKKIGKNISTEKLYLVTHLHTYI